MGGGDESSATTKRCGILELTIFTLAVITGTACSICSKTMMDMHGIGIDGDREKFTKPLFQTFGMFVGMLLGLVMHEIVLFFKIPFPGYDHIIPTSSSTTSENGMSKAQTNGYGSIDEEKALIGSGNGNGKAPAPTTSSSSRKPTPMWLLLFRK